MHTDGLIDTRTYMSKVVEDFREHANASKSTLNKRKV